jgi:predicted permease
MDALGRDLRLALRTLLGRPGFTAAAILTLALGIGANTAVFSVVDSVLLRELPVEDPASLVDVYTSDASGFEHATSSYPDIRDLRAQAPVFTDVVAYELFIGVAEREGEPAVVLGELVTGNAFQALGVEPVLGRGFLPEEDELPGAHPVAVVSHGYWTEEMGADPGAVGRTVRVNRRLYTVVGVAPPEFTGLTPALSPDLWVPAAMASVLKPSATDRLESRGNRSLFVKARRAPGVSLEEARTWVREFSTRLARAHPETNEERWMTLVPAGEVAIHPAVDRALIPVAGLLLGVVGLVLLVACANLASFLLARAEDRRREVAVRLALGAGRVALVRQLLVEAGVLAATGAAVGWAVARGSLDLVTRVQPPLPLPVSLDFTMDGSVLAFTAVVAGVAALAFGLAPALQATRPDVVPALKDGAAPEGTGRRLRLRDALVVGQVAFSLLLLVGAGLFARSLGHAHSLDPGFDTGPAAILWPQMQLSGLDETEGRATYLALEEALLAHPAVDAVAAADVLPLGMGFQTAGLEIPGVPPSTADGLHHVDFSWVSSSYFEALGIPLVTGRSFRRDDGTSEAPVAMVSRAFAERYLAGRDPVGQVVRTGDGAELRIVGVVEDTKVRTLGEEPRPRFYRPLGATYLDAVQMVVKGSGSSPELLAVARKVVREVEPRLVLLEAKTMEQHLALMLFPPRMAALLLGVVGTLALALAAVGIYGVVSFAVARRTREMGIRQSLGASPGEVRAMMVWGGMRLVGIGTGLGLMLALGAGALLSRFLLGVEPWDPVTFLTIPALLGMVALGAAWIPARRAAAVEPVRALRS